MWKTVLRRHPSIPYSHKALKKVRCVDWREKLINPINPKFRLQVKDKPFRHYILDDFLKLEVFQQVRQQSRLIPLDYNDEHRGSWQANVDGPLYVRYAGDWHDAYRVNINPAHGLQINIFNQRDMAEFIWSFFPQLEFSNKVTCELHHHGPFSRDGFVHNDYDPARFEEVRPYDGMDTGWFSAGSEACDSPHQGQYFQRSLAFAYYVALGPKVQDDRPLGGHTAFFTEEDKVKPAAGCAPVENRLLLFAINPTSYHASRTNNSVYRDALFGWYYSEQDFMRKLYPNHDMCAGCRGKTNTTSDPSYGYAVEDSEEVLID